MQRFCQSCTMPLDNADIRGTEKDGSPSADYCKYCYKDGAFTSPDIDIDGMKVVVSDEMSKRHFPPALIQKAVELLPYLRRWNTFR